MHYNQFHYKLYLVKIYNSNSYDIDELLEYWLLYKNRHKKVLDLAQFLYALLLLNSIHLLVFGLYNKFQHQQKALQVVL